MSEAEKNQDRLSRDTLKLGLQEALNLYTLEWVSYETLARGVDKAILRVRYQGRPNQLGRTPGERSAIVKWYVEEPFPKEPAHTTINNLDRLLNSEIRGLEHLRSLTGDIFVPRVLGSTTNYRMIVLEEIIGEGKGGLRKKKLLHALERDRFTGVQTVIPHAALEILINSQVIAGSFAGTCKAYASELLRRYDYGADARTRDGYLGLLFQERLARLHAYVRGEEIIALPPPVSGRSAELVELSRHFGESDEFNHGDFNLTQLIGNNVIDLELFGLYQQGKDVGTGAVVVGLKDSSGLITCDNFATIVDYHFAAKQEAEDALRSCNQDDPEDVKLALKRAMGGVYAMKGTTSPADVKALAVKYLRSPEQYQDRMVNVYYHAFNELLRLGAAFDRMRTRGIGNGSTVEYLQGIVQGLECLANYVTGQDSLFDGVTNAAEKREYFKTMSSLLADLQLITKFKDS